MESMLPDTIIDLPVCGIRLERKGGCGVLQSDLHEENESPEAKMCVDALESMVLAHFVAGVDVASPAYCEGIVTAVDAIAANVPC